MKKLPHIPWLIIMNAVILLITGILCIWGSQSVNITVAKTELRTRKTVIIDAGHGGIDTGATSCTGVSESSINLQISLKLRDLFHLLGVPTQMIRTTDCSVHTQGNTIASQKVSDIKNRVQQINGTPNSIFISIHQNSFPSSKYAGSQVFYGIGKNSKQLADQLQKTLIDTINPGSKRTSKKASNIYLLEHITRTGVLLECGFLSNFEEEKSLRDPAYQNKLCCVIVSVYTNYLKENMVS